MKDEEQEFSKIELGELIILCKNFDKIEDFSKSISNFCKTEKDLDRLVNELNNSNNNLGGTRRVRKFHQENKVVLDTAHEYYDAALFIRSNFNVNGTKYGIIDKYYNYIKNNIKPEDREKAVEFLLKVKDLGITTICLSPGEDFTHQIYNIPKDTKKCYIAYYLENMQLASIYPGDNVVYKTNGSEYEISMRTGVNGIYNKHIVVNNLLIDPEKLPEELSKKYVFGAIFKLCKDIENTNKQVRVKEAVDIEYAIRELIKQYYSLNALLRQITNPELQYRACKALAKINLSISSLRELSHEYEVIVSHYDISKEDLEFEKKLNLTNTKKA